MINEQQLWNQAVAILERNMTSYGSQKPLPMGTTRAGLSEAQEGARPLVNESLSPVSSPSSETSVEPVKSDATSRAFEQKEAA
jgi:hypothetical protein